MPWGSADAWSVKSRVLRWCAQMCVCVCEMAAREGERRPARWSLARLFPSNLGRVDWRDCLAPPGRLCFSCCCGPFALVCLPACLCVYVCEACCSTYSSLLSPKLRSRSPSLHAIPLPHSTHPTLLLLTHPLITPSLSLHTLGLAITRPKFTADVHLFIFLFTSIAIAILFRPLTKRTLRSSAPAVSKRPPGRLQQTCRANPRFSINKISVS
jgi:hypothetical protein